MLVIDASIALAWLFEDPQHDGALEVLNQVACSGAVVPVHWWLEVGNALLAARLAKRLHRDVWTILAPLRALPIQIDTESAALASSHTLRLAVQLGIKTYDAAYLELAERYQVPLGTLDHALAALARTRGLQLALPA